jgi:hypothetical protein
MPRPHRARCVSWRLAGALVALLACNQPAVAPRPAARAPDKAELFGDPTLIPTREGEAARRELAGAGELTAVLRASGWLEQIHVDVEHGDPIRVVVAGRRTAAAPASLVEPLDRVAAAVLGDEAELVLAIAETPPAEPRAPARELPLLLAALGLGASVALLLDRSVRRRRTRSLRVRGHAR